MKIELGKKYTSNGQPIRILCTDREDASGYNVVGVSSDGGIKCFRSNGDCSLDSKYDLQEVWVPSEGEWCWFWDNDEPAYSALDKFKRMGPCDLFQSTNCSTWKHCSKFTSELPEHLKRN
jgi:hypothetical protein